MSVGPEHPMRRRSELLTDALHLCALVALAIAQPLFDTLSRSPEFFFVRRATAFDVVLTAFLLSVVAPAALVLAEVAASFVGRGVQKTLHAILVTGLVGVFLLPVLARLPLPGTALLAVAATLALAFTAAYLRYPGLRTFLTVVSPCALVFPALFLLGSSMSVILFPPTVEAGGGTTASSTSIVMIVLDEFPTEALLDEHGGIDAARYPNLAALAKEGTWFRNATTVASMTEAAVAAIVTGRYPGPLPLGASENHGKNIFSLLSSSHELHVVEGYVSYCPRELCTEAGGEDAGQRTTDLVRDLVVLALHVVLPRDMRAALPDLTHPTVLLKPDTEDRMADRQRLLALVGKHRHATTRTFYRADLVDRFVERIDGPRPTLHYLHVLLPHTPYDYGASGKVCAAWPEPEGVAWGSDRAAVGQSYQRLLLQVGYVDSIVGRIVARLKALDLYESTLLVVTADHGIAHRPKDKRRAITRSNYCDILPVPLFVKLPHQRAGGVSDRNVEIVDILPTVADAVGIRVPWPVDGQSLRAAARRERDRKVVVHFGWDADDVFDGRERVDFPASQATECLVRARTEDETAALVGRRVADLHVAGDAEATLELAYPDLYRHVDPDSAFAPCLIEGWLKGRLAGHRLAVAVNGTIRAVTEAQDVPDDPAVRFAAVVPDTALRPGDNDVAVFVISDRDGDVQLTPTRGPLAPAYTLHEDAPGAGVSITSADGSTIPLRPDAMVGALERVAAREVTAAAKGDRVLEQYAGWAADVTRHEPAAMVLVFVDGKLHHVTRPDVPRPDVQRRYGTPALRRVGFAFVLPTPLRAAGDETRIRVFAVSRAGVASEIERQAS